MIVVSYSSVMGSLMYAQVCTHPDIAFVVSVLGRYLRDPGQSYLQSLEVSSGYQGSHVDISAYRHF